MRRPLSGLLAAVLLWIIPSAARADMFAPLWPFGPRGLQLQPPPLIGGNQFEDVYVMPSRPGQNRVSFWNFEWQTWEFRPEPGGGGVRLFFYPREREAASYAVYSIREQYELLTERFKYMPRTQIPFVLYASYAEFQATNVFFITEGTLGATDPRDLRMAQPFFGDVRKFTRVSTHEMAHQFTIQKVRDAALAAGTENPLMAFPLWFIEGLAEYMVYLGMDPEGDMMVRDLLLNPVPEQGYALPDFFNATAGGYIGVYKLGQARLTFLAQVYGHQKVLELMERSPEMVGAPPPGVDAPPAPRGPPPAMPGQPQAPPDAEPTPEDQGLPPSAVADADKVPQGPPASFEDYMARVLGESPTRIRERYQAWLKRRYFDSFLDARQNVADFALYMGLKGEPDSFSVSPDGNLILYRTVERMTGLSSLYLQDLRAPDSRVIIATDQRPGLESLHPVDRRVTSLGADRLVFTARSGETDVLYVVPFKTETGTEGGVVTAKITLGERQRFDLGEILEVFDPVLAPDGQRVVFAGVDLEGFRDLYALNVEGPNRGRIERLTHDVWAESDLSWDGNRILFVSDATESHEPNVFALDLQTRATERLTHHGEEDRQPVAALGGVVFRSYRGGKPELWLLKDGQTRPLTDSTASPLAAAPAADGGLWTLIYYKGEHRLYRIGDSTLLPPPRPELPKGDAVAGADAVGEPAVGGSGMELATFDRGMIQAVPYPRARLPEDVKAYQPGDPRNWRLEGGGAALVGAGTAGAAGIAVTDLLRNHTVMMNLAVYGTLRLTDASLFYLNQSRRLNLGIGAFHTFEPRRDKTFPEVQNFFLQRSFGVAGLVRYPLDRFRRVESVLELRGIERFGFTDYTGERFPEGQRLNAGSEPEIVLSAAAGRDTMRLHALAGPVEGNSVLLQASTGLLPVRRAAYARLMADAQQRIRLIGRTHLALRASGGTTYGGRFSPQFFLSSLDNLRGFNFGDPRLLGDHYYVSNALLIVPVDWLIATPLLSGIYAVGGADFGAAFDDFRYAWTRRSLTAVTGANLALGGILLQLHFGKLVDIGGVPGADWVFNLNLKYLYM